MYKISTGFAVSVLLVIAVTIGGIFWLIGKQEPKVKRTTPILQETNPLLPTSPTVPKLRVNDTTSQAASLQQKWTAAGLDAWSAHDLFDQGIAVVSPAESSVAHYQDAAHSPDFNTPNLVRTYLGVFRFGDFAQQESDKVWGITTVSLFKDKIAEGQSLENFLLQQGEVIHKEECAKGWKPEPTYDENHKRIDDGKCHIGEVNGSKQLQGTGIILWNDGYISAPPHLSKVLSDNRVLDFQLGQDGSDETQWIALVQDILATATIHPVE